MAFSSITQTVSLLPTPPTTADPATFDSRADAYLTAEKKLSGELQTLIQQLNAFSASGNTTAEAINTSEANASNSAVEASDYANIAKAMSNYKGEYDANVTYSQGESVTFSDNVYVSKVDSNDASPTLSTSTDKWYFNGRKDFVYKTITADYIAINLDGIDVDTHSIAQVDVVDSFTVVDSTDYIVTIDGTDYKYTSDSDATAAEITAGIKDAIDADSDVAVTTVDDSGVSVTLTAKVAGTAFDASINDNMLDTTTIANKAGPITVTLPASPSENEVISFLDLKGTFDTNNLTVTRNGNNIMGKGEDMVVSTKNISFKLRFTDNNWRLV